MSLELKRFGNIVELNSIDSVINHSNSCNIDSHLFSLQYAPYSISPNGICRKPLKQLADFLKDKITHLNFHEIWIGSYPKAPLKEKSIGWIQQKEILRFIKKINPKFITTSNSAALHRLNSLGIQAKYLYLFGNIPYSANHRDADNEFLKVAFFGTLYSKFPYELLLEKINLISKTIKKPVELLFIGRQRESSGIELLQKITDKYKFSVKMTGELSSNLVSHEFQNADIGICTTPYDILGKSGSCAAMLEHRLPVLAFDDGDTPSSELFIINEFNEQVFLLNDDYCHEHIISYMQKQRKPYFDGVAYTVQKLLELYH